MTYKIDVICIHGIVRKAILIKHALPNNICKCNWKYDPMSYDMICVMELGYSKLDVVEIYCGAATYDKIEKDVKVTPETALGLIGGTMGFSNLHS